MKEVCSCGAKFEIQRDGTTTWTDEGFKRILAAMKDWRENHRHEMPEPEPEIPTVVESNSSHERFVDEFPIEDRAPVGFQRNELRH